MTTENVTDFPTNETAEPTREALLMQPNPELLDALRDAHERIKTKKDERKEINQSISAIYTELEGYGIDKKAAKAVFAFYELDEDQRRLYDLSASVTRKALRMPLQGDLFLDAQAQATGEAAQKKSAARRSH